MKTLTAVLAVAGGSLMVALLGPSQAQDDGLFELVICNASGVKDVHVALTTRTETYGQWRVHGWYPIADSGCTDMGAYRRSYFYTYAEGRGGTYWGSGNSHQCINPKVSFERIVGTEGYTCGSGETLVAFTRRDVEPSKRGVELTLR